MVARGDRRGAPLTEGHPSESDSAPSLLIESLGCRAGPAGDRWLAAWRIRNVGASPLRLLEAWAPHGQFRAAVEQLSRGVDLPPGESTRLELLVTCRDRPGAVVENAFLILRLLWRGHPWRVLTRMRVVFDAKGTPQHICERTTAQPVGFSASVS